jgi:hypothetical protein
MDGATQERFLKKGLDNKPLLCYNKDTNEREVKTMAKKNKKKIDRRCFKKEGQELQDYLHFMRRGSRKESGKAYNRQKMKRGDKE